MRKIEFACHTAYVDPETGCGLLVRPLPREDVADPVAVGTLQAADWSAALRYLYEQGWEPTEDERGDLVQEGYTLDGREVVGLYGWEPSAVLPTQREAEAAAFQTLRSLAGLA